MARKIEKAKNGNFVCPHCGSDNTYQSGSPTLTTENIELHPYWCGACSLPFHVETKNGKAVGESEF